MTETVESVLEYLERVGLIGSWYCEVCRDKVPYKKLEMTEPDSRRAHDADHHAPGNGPNTRHG